MFTILLNSPSVELAKRQLPIVNGKLEVFGTATSKYRDNSIQRHLPFRIESANQS